MARAYFVADTLDDLMREAIEEINRNGKLIRPTKGGATEITGVLLELTNPRARLSRTESRGKPYSCLGELCWYLAGSRDLDFISYYLSRYKDAADGNEIYGGYGPRLLNWKGLHQLDTVTEILREKPNSRQAVIQLFDGKDIVEEHKDVPCTCTLQFMRRDDKLQMLTNMRSNDVIVGFPHDFFCFTMLQEIVARSLGIDVGSYKHCVGSLHIYTTDDEEANHFLEEGWQSTEAPMPSMPLGNPWPAIRLLLAAESSIRTTGTFDDALLNSVDAYWADLIRLLGIFGFKKRKDIDPIRKRKKEMVSNTYSPFIDRLMNQ